MPREFALGFAYWLSFLLLLEPGNLARVFGSDVPLAWTEEMLRIAGASLLGAAVTPVLLRMTRRFPIEGLAWRKRALIHAACIGGLSFGLILAAQVLATWVLAGRDPRLEGSLGEELASNGALLVLCMTAFTAMAHAVRFLRRAEREGERLAAATRIQTTSQASRVPIKTRGGVLLLPLEEVDWVETQGNYVALHAGPKAHLVRETLARFERRLDPQRFVRIHRRVIVRADRVRELTNLTNGDALLRLADGTELRLSRGYRTLARSAFGANLSAVPLVSGAPQEPR